MRRTALFVLLAGVVAVALAPGRAHAMDEDVVTYDARVTDVGGVATDLTGFGFATGLQVLVAFRGEAEVEVPLRLVRSIDVAAYDADRRRYPATLTLASGKALAVVLDGVEAGRLLYGRADFGRYWIRLAKVRRIELHRPTADVGT